jgi:hypothetical protein
VAINEDAGPGEGIETPTGGESDHAGTPDPSGGGCLKLGWGCLPVLVGSALLVPGAWSVF